MKPLHIFLLALAMFSLATAPALAQQKRVSPHETLSTRFGRDLVMIVYGRPYSKDPKSDEIRKIWGTLVPWDKVWRTGSDEATLLITQKPLAFGDTTVPAGAYTLFTVPSEKGTTKLVINKEIGQWGIPYLAKDDAQELCRLDMTRGSVDKSVDQFTMAINKKSNDVGTILETWETTTFAIDFKVQH